jgi:hypothetical protein
LAAFQASHDKALLDEAIAKYPNDPRVAFTAWYRSPSDTGDPDGLQARRQALEHFKQTAPDNSLANYLSAANYFKSGQTELALSEIQAGAAKPKYDDYVNEAIQNMQEAYQAAGYSDVESKLAATTGALLPHLAELKKDGVSLVELANSYSQAGDAASAQQVLQMSLGLGERVDDPGSMTLIQTLVGIAIERKALDAMVAAATDPSSSAAIQDQINALQQKRDAIKTLASGQQMETWIQTAPSQELSSYFDRMRFFGEQSAMQWWANRNRQQ